MTCPPHRWLIPQSDKGLVLTGVCIICETTREFTNVYEDRGFNATGQLTTQEEAYLRLTDTRKSMRHRTDSIGGW